MCAGRSHAVCDALLWQLQKAHTGSLALCPTSSPERARCAGMHGGGASVCTCVYKTRGRAMGSHRRPGAGGRGSSFFHVNASPTILSLIQGASRGGDGRRAPLPPQQPRPLARTQATGLRPALQMAPRRLSGGQLSVAGTAARAGTGCGSAARLLGLNVTHSRSRRRRGLPQPLARISITILVQKERGEARRQAAALLPSPPAPSRPALPARARKPAAICRKGPATIPRGPGAPGSRREAPTSGGAVPFTAPSGWAHLWAAGRLAKFAGAAGAEAPQVRAPLQGAGSARLTSQEAVQTATTRRPCPTHRRLSPARGGVSLWPGSREGCVPGELGLCQRSLGTWIRAWTGSRRGPGCRRPSRPRPPGAWGASASPMLSSG